MNDWEAQAAEWNLASREQKVMVHRNELHDWAGDAGSPTDAQLPGQFREEMMSIAQLWTYESNLVCEGSWVAHFVLFLCFESVKGLRNSSGIIVISPTDNEKKMPASSFSSSSLSGGSRPLCMWQYSSLAWYHGHSVSKGVILQNPHTLHVSKAEAQRVD